MNDSLFFDRCKDYTVIVFHSPLSMPSEYTRVGKAIYPLSIPYKHRKLVFYVALQSLQSILIRP